MKIIVLNDSHKIKDVLTFNNVNQIIIGRQGREPVDINLAEDRQVSHQHARITISDGAYWLEDLGSLNGTYIDETKITGKTRLSAGIKIRTGETSLIIESEDTMWKPLPINGKQSEKQGVKLRAFKLTRDLVIDIETVSAINYSLCHCRIPIVSCLEINNQGDMPAKNLLLKLSIHNYAESEPVKIQQIDSGETYKIEGKQIKFNFSAENLQALSEKVRATFQVSINGEDLAKYNVWVLPYNEWSLEKEHRTALACFVQPNSPVINLIERRAIKILQKYHGKNSFDALIFSENAKYAVKNAVEVIYNCLKDKFDLHYSKPPVCFEHHSQRVRLPDQIIQDELWGQGTCIDLALLMAACLEKVHIHPLILLVEMDGYHYHALVGYRLINDYHHEAIITDKNYLLDLINSKKLLVMNSTGFAKSENDEKRDFYSCTNDGLQYLKDYPLIYAIDIKALRYDDKEIKRKKITPLPFNKDPYFSKNALLALDNAYRAAKDYQMVNPKNPNILLLANPHLLIGLLELNEVTAEMFKKLGKNSKKVKDILSNFARRNINIRLKEIKATKNFRRVKELAKLEVRQDRSLAVEERHLLLALLSLNDKSIDRIFQKLDVNVNLCIKELKSICHDTDKIFSSYVTFLESFDGS